ncbi:MAG: hypothetical protein HON90_06485, partial [Halobacteriovoraceae bacterium]|nr:hypothetical protein [Halobacteriovoraceae bacterium]
MKKKKDEKKNLAIEDLTLKPFLHEDHKMPKTRREFMAHGFYGITTTMVLPSFASMVLSQNEAYAQTVACELPQFSAGLPYLCIDVAGGMNIPGANVMVGMAANGEHQEDYGSGGNDYLRLGIVSGEHPLAATTIVNGKLESDKVEKKYGLKFHRASGVLEGMKSVLDGQMMPNGRPIEDGIDGLVFCTRTSDDTAANPINTVYMANKAGAKGELVQLVGNSSTDTGARSAAPGGEINLNLRPSLVARNSDAEGLLSLGGTMGSAA